MSETYPMRWWREQRGGYAYAELIPCRVVRTGAKRVKIAALRKDGTEAERWIDPRNLRPRPAESV